MVVKTELAKVRRLAVTENLFSQSNEHVSATRITEFWEYVSRKFRNVEEVVIITKVERNSLIARGGTPGHLEREGLVRRIEKGLKFVVRGSVWKPPRWFVITPQTDGFKGLVWPVDDLVKRKADRQSEAQAGGPSGGFDLAFWSAVL